MCISTWENYQILVTVSKKMYCMMKIWNWIWILRRDVFSQNNLMPQSCIKPWTWKNEVICLVVAKNTKKKEFSNVASNVSVIRVTPITFLADYTRSFLSIFCVQHFFALFCKVFYSGNKIEAVLQTLQFSLHRVQVTAKFLGILLQPLFSELKHNDV